tara:strand:+ start:3322 stop:3825 length:504 start_codon:yes stop_codon:yes gene_type:complete
MNEEIKNQMLLNSDSYEFFLNKTRDAEKMFFKKAEECGKEMERVTNEVKEIGHKPNTPQWNLSISRRINLNIFSNAIDEGEKYKLLAKKFASELNMMIDLSSNLLDEDLKFDNPQDREGFLETYETTVNSAILMQERVNKLIDMELKMIRKIKEATENGKWEDESYD